MRGLYLWGGVGRGKTHLMDWFVDALPLPGKRRVHFHHFMHEIHAAMAHLPKQPDPLEVLAEREAARTRVLCLDEFVVSDITDAMILYGLLRALFARGVTLVTTSNTPPQALYRNGLQRQRFVPAIELLERHTRVFELDGGTDYRLRVLTAGGVYFVAEAEGGGGGGVGGLLRATHRGPCPGPSRPTGQRARSPGATYRGRCGLVRLRYPVRRAQGHGGLHRDRPGVSHRAALRASPVLTPRHDAAARRLLHLIDEFYDRRVKLIVSAAAPVERALPGGLHDFAHARLLSRLTEMQSVEYLAAGRPSAV